MILPFQAFGTSGTNLISQPVVLLHVHETACLLSTQQSPPSICRLSVLCDPRIILPAQRCAQSKGQRQPRTQNLLNGTARIHAPLFHTHTRYLRSGIYHREVGSGYTVIRTGDFRLGSRCCGMSRLCPRRACGFN